MTQSRAMLCALAAFFLWVVGDTAVKLGGQEALTPFMIMAISGTVGAVGIFGVSLTRRNIRALRPRSWRGQSLISLCAVAISFLNIIALKHLPLTIFYIVAFMAPLAIAGLSSFLKHETPTLLKIACLIAGFIGVVFAVAPRHWGGGEWIGYLAAFINVFIFTTSTVTMRKLSRTDTIRSIQFSKYLCIGVVGIAGMLVQSLAVPFGWALAMVTITSGIGMFGSVLYNMALKHTVSTNVAQLHYTQIIWGAILGYLIWHDVPTWNLIVGSSIIIASGMIVATQMRRSEVAAR